MSEPSAHSPKLPPAPPPSRLARWRQLPRGERRLALQLLCLLPLIDLSLRSVGFQRSQAWLGHFLPEQPPAPDVSTGELAVAQRMAELARAVGARSPWRTSCLRQALAVWLLLRRRRLPAVLRIGVIRREGPFQAHAWVEVGKIALDPDAAAHAVFPEFPGPRARSTPT